MIVIGFALAVIFVLQILFCILDFHPLGAYQTNTHIHCDGLGNQY